MIMAYDEYPDIYIRSKAIVFLGTPHRGSESANFATVISQIANVAWKLTPGPAVMRTGSTGISNTRLLNTLSLGSEELMDISSTFRHRASDFLICTFYEQKFVYPLNDLASSPLHNPPQ